MVQKEKFHKMTKPIRFRFLKEKSMILKQILKSKTAPILCSIGYLRLHEKHLIDEHPMVNTASFVIKNSLLQLPIEVTLSKTTITKEYWYYIKKNGKDIKYLEYEDSHDIIFNLRGESVYKDSMVRVGNEWYSFNMESRDYPIIRIATKPSLYNPEPYDEFLNPTLYLEEYREYQVDTSKLHLVYDQTLHGNNIDYDEMFKSRLVGVVKQNMQEALNRVMFSDVVREV